MLRSPASTTGNVTNANLVNSTAVTQNRLDNSTLVATDQFVNQQISSSRATIPVTTTGGLYNQASLGSGLQIVIFVSGGVISSILSIVTGGTNYAVGDVLIVNGGNSDAIVRITNVSGGVVQSGGVSVLYGGTGYTTGATVPVTPVPPGQRTVVLSGVLTSNVTFIIQNGTLLTASRHVELINNTTGNFSTTVFLSNGAGGTVGNGVVIPQGTNNSSAVFLYTDGVNDVWLADATTGTTNIRTIAASTSITQSDYTVLVNATGGAVTLTLSPSANSQNRIVCVKKIDASANTVTVKGNGAELIDAANTNVLSAQFAAAIYHNDRTQWWII